MAGQMKNRPPLRDRLALARKLLTRQIDDLHASHVNQRTGKIDDPSVAIELASIADAHEALTQTIAILKKLR